MNFDFAMTGADGKEMRPLHGPGLTGLRNLGNRYRRLPFFALRSEGLFRISDSCYMASSLQSIFSLPSFQERYLTAFYTHSMTCTNPSPATCFECQMAKVADGLLSGRYAVPREPEQDASFADSAKSDPSAPAPTVAFQEGIRPSMFKALVGKNHPEFSTMRQQDAGEFLAYLLETIRRSSRAEGTEDPTRTFAFSLEERVQCNECKGVRYKRADEELLPIPVPVNRKGSAADAMDIESGKKDAADEFETVELATCFNNLTAPTDIEYTCPACAKKVNAVK